MTYIGFKEENDHEGETWRFYLHLEGNEAAVELLERAITSQGEDSVYTIFQKDFSEKEVDRLCAQSYQPGYMAPHTKLEGRLILPDCFHSAVIDINEIFNALYKGGLVGCMLPPNSVALLKHDLAKAQSELIDVKHELRMLDHTLSSINAFHYTMTRSSKIAFMLKVLDKADPKGEIAKAVRDDIEKKRTK